TAMSQLAGAARPAPAAPATRAGASPAPSATPATPATPAEPADGEAAGREAAVGHAREMYDALSSKSGMRPDVFALFTPANRLAFVAPPRVLDEQALPAIAAVEKARGGSAFAHRIQVIDGVPYQMSALPIRGPRDQVVGGMLVGVKLERLFAEFA